MLSLIQQLMKKKKLNILKFVVVKLNRIYRDILANLIDLKA